MSRILARAGGLLATIALASAMLLAPMFVRHVAPVQLSAVNAASVTACTWTRTAPDTTITAKGTVTTRQTTKYACGKAYQEWKHITSQSPTGAHYVESVYKDARDYPHYRQVTVYDGWTAKGTYRHYVRVKIG